MFVKSWTESNDYVSSNFSISVMIGSCLTEDSWISETELNFFTASFFVHMGKKVLICVAGYFDLVAYMIQESFLYVTEFLLITTLFFLDDVLYRIILHCNRISLDNYVNVI